MAPEGGPLFWGDSPPLRAGVWLDGTLIDGGVQLPINEWNRETGAAILPTVGGVDIAQLRWLTGDAPVNLHAMKMSGINFNLVDEADYWLLHRVASVGQPVNLFFDVPMADYWYIPGKVAGQTTWKTSRKLPWDLTGVTHVTTPPHAYVDSVAQTIIKTGTPSTGEVKVPETGGFGTITTPSGLTGTWLELRYAPQLLVVLRGINFTMQQANFLIVNCPVEEQRGGLYTPGV